MSEWVGARYIVKEGEGERDTLNLKDTTLTPTRDSLPCLLGRAVDLI